VVIAAQIRKDLVNHCAKGLLAWSDLRKDRAQERIEGIITVNVGRMVTRLKRRNGPLEC
jgi:hypothetical protein